MIDMTNITPLPSGNFRVRIEYRKEILGGTFATVGEAVEVRNAIKQKLVDGQLVPTKGSSAIDLGPKFLASRAGNRSVSDDEGRWHLRVKHAAWARLRVDDVTRKHGAAWLEELKRERTAYDPKKHGTRRSKPISWGLRRHYLNLARAFFSWTVDQELITSNPFRDLTVEREDGDEDEGYQEDWYLDVAEQTRLLSLWDTLPSLNWRDRLEKWTVQLALWTGLRINELWCLHLSDLHIDGPKPHLVVRYGSWDPIKERFRGPKGRKGEKKRRTVPLWGGGLEAAVQWMAVRAEYLKMNPRTERERAARGYEGSPLVFPTERGRLRDNKPPRSWKRVVDAFGVVPRIGEKPWFHLLRHSCASSLVSKAWSDEYWPLKAVQKVLGHADIRTTQQYAHFEASALEETAARAEKAFQLAKVIPLRRHAAVTPVVTDSAEAGNKGHAREDSNLRPTAPEGGGSATNADEIARHDGLVTAVRHVLRDVADRKYGVPVTVAEDLGRVLELVLAATPAAVAPKERA